MSFENEEVAAFNAFRQSWATVNPPPRKPERADWTSLGWTFLLTLLSGVAAIGLVALRTASEFYEASFLSFQNPTVALVEAVLAIVGIEGTMFTMGIKTAKRISEGWKRRITEITSWLVVSISLLAGFSHSMGIVPDLPDTFRYYFLVALSIGLSLASIVALTAGLLVGMDIASLDESYQVRYQEYQEALNIWRDELKSAWQRSPERRVARADILDQYDEVRGSRKVSESFGNFQAQNRESFGNFPDQSERVDWRRMQKSEQRKVKDMNVQEVMQKYGVSERTASNWIKYSEDLG